MGTIKALIGLLYQLTKWRCIALELKTRTLVLDKVKEVERRHDELEKEHVKLRAAGRHADADRVLDKQVEYACFRRGILDLGKRADIYSKAEGDLRGPGDSREKGSPNPEPIKVT